MLETGTANLALALMHSIAPKDKIVEAMLACQMLPNGTEAWMGAALYWLHALDQNLLAIGGHVIGDQRLAAPIVLPAQRLSAGLPPAMTSSPATSWPVSCLPPLSSGGSN